MRPVERLPEVVLGRCRGSGRALQQNELALNAQQLGNQPAFFGMLGSRHRLLDHGEPVGDLPGTGQGFRHQERDEPQGDELGFAEFVKAGAQQPQSGGGIPTLDDEHPLMAAAPGLPERQRMACRMVEQQAHVMFRRSQIADQQCDRTCRLGQSVTQ